MSRSQVMVRVRGSDTVPEKLMRHALWHAGLRYRIQAKDLPGRPDIVFRSARLAIYVHGCFWHRHPGCKHARIPKSRPQFWEEKLGGNIERDVKNIIALRELDWTELIVWECEVRDSAKLQSLTAVVAQLVGRRKI